MELIGEEKRIRALFSEVRFADSYAAPSFNSMWRRAESRSIQPRRAFNFSFVAAAALVVVALASSMVWLKYSQPSGKNYAAVANVAASSNFTSVVKYGSDATPRTTNQQVAHAAKGRAAKLAAARRAMTIAANPRVAGQAKQIASWKSPTASLLSSSSDDLLKSLPRLNENAAELKSFLPNSSDNKEN